MRSISSDFQGIGLCFPKGKLQGKFILLKWFIMNDPLLPVYPRNAGLEFREGSGVYLTDTEGRRFLDFAGGIAVNVLGYAHPHLLAHLRENLNRPWHLSNLYVIPEQRRLAQRLLERTTFAEKVFFTNSGAEAVECAIKMARRYHFHCGNPDRYELLTFEGAFHGRTLATVAAGGRAKYMEGLGAPIAGFRSLPFADITAVEEAINSKTGGVLLETIQGEGGIRAWPVEALKRLSAVCNTHGLLLIIDEVQCGMGRSGYFFAYEHAGIEPDIVALAKGLGGGFPLGACLASGKAASGMSFGVHGSTFGGNPLAMAVGNAVLDVIFDSGFLSHVEQVARLLWHGLQQLQQSHPAILQELRGCGLMVGLRCDIPKEKLITALREQNLLCVGADDNVVRLLPPLIVDKEHVEEALTAIESACRVLEAEEQEIEKP